MADHRLILCAPNFVEGDYTSPVIGGGDWAVHTNLDGTTVSSLSKLASELFIEKAISTDATTASTKGTIDLGATYPVGVVHISGSNIESGGTIRWYGSNTIAWSNISINGSHTAEDNTISMSNGGGSSVTISSGDVFTISGDTTVYQVTSGATISAAGTGVITIVRVDKSGTGIVTALSGGEAVTCHTGDFSSTVFDTTALNYPMSIDSTTGFAALSFPNAFTHIFSSNHNVRYIKWEMVNTSNSDGYLTIENMIIAPFHAFYMEYGAQFGVQSNTSKIISSGGTAAFNIERSQRTLSFSLGDISVSEGFTTVVDILRECDIYKTLLVAYDEEDTTLLPRRCFPCRISNISPMTHVYYNGLSIPITLIERIS